MDSSHCHHGPELAAVTPEVVFLSPHLDDAVLSAGALIARIAAEGRRVEVWTFFTNEPLRVERRGSGRIFGDYPTRYAEDERALARLGAGHRWLGYSERFFREPPLSNPLRLFCTPDAASAFLNLASMSSTISSLLDRPGLQIYAPLGVGNHYDHVEVALAAMRVLLERNAFDRILFYEDFYAADAAARRRHFVARHHVFNPLRAPAWANPALGALLRLGSAFTRGPGIESYLPRAAQLAWSYTIATVDQFELTKCAAVDEYRSQVAAFGGMKRLAPFLRRFHRACGGELIWRARSSAQTGVAACHS